MAQRDKVKELVGRGLHSYHTKALQQIDRIEKKNKEQNHKISILSNELDNDYLTKTEEGSVISLEHSKEGMVYLDELQGNTLVNYCTDGSKELTLNGDIDVEGTFVTTTEGVDGGKIDVMCEGNTLVNLKHNKYDNCGVSCGGGDKSTYVRIDKNSPISLKGEILQTGQANNNTWQYFAFGKINMNLLKTNTTYTLIIKDEYKTTKGVYIQNGDTSHCFTVNSSVTSKYVGNYNYVVLKTKDDFTGLNPNYPILYGSLSSTYAGKLDISIMGMFEGDLTNQEIPNEFFDGMKSVGQDDTNGHKIEILSQNKNLLTSDKFEKWGNEINIEYSGDIEKYVECSKTPFEVKPNTTYTFSALMKATSNLKNAEMYVYEYRKGETKFFKATPKQVSTNDILDFKRISYTFTTTSNTDRILLRFDNNGSSDGNIAILTCKEYCLSLGNNTVYAEPMFNKKEILINEPLRSVGNTKDKFVKIGGKWFIEKKCEEIVFDGSDDEKWSFKVTEPSGKYSYKIDPAIVGSTNGRPNGICDKFTFVNWNSNPWNYKSNCISILSNGVYVYTDFTTLSEFKTWLQSNPFTLICELATPVYEPLEIEPTLNTYTDITHISNNSIIPCNMKIKNSGYNAIIKPSTLYTIALDTNKSGTIGMNLGGAKGTTTNNVLKLTTPATLTDDSLRLYGKGIKGSKVRLLEGDKTNWIPSFFEGMKSSFEDKLQDDGTYKMEILMNNKNLFDANCFKDLSKWNVCMGSSSWKYYPIYIGKNKKAYMKRVYKDNLSDYPMVIVSKDKDYGMNIGGWMPIIHGNVTEKVYKGYILPDANGFIYLLTAHTDYNKLVATIENCIISTVDVDYIEQKSNKIQFSSIEPLRSLPNGVKDKFIFKDGKLMIERNTSKSKVNNIKNVDKSYDGWNNIVFAYKVEGLISVGTSIRNVWSNLLPSRDIAELCNTLGKTGIASHNWADRKLQIAIKGIDTVEKMKEWISKNDLEIVYQIEPTYEEIPFELQKVILEGYENGTLFFDTNIPPTSTVTYAGETPIVKATKLNKTEVLSNTEDINDNIIPYLMDMDYRVVMLQLATEELEGGVSMARLFGGTYEMIKRDILSKRLTREEYGYRLADYFNAGKLTEEQVRELEDLR